MRARLVSVVALLALAVGSLLLSGCGATLDPVAQAATRTAAVSTFRFTMSMQLQTPSGSAPIAVTGAVDKAAHRLALTMDLSKAAELAGTSGDLGRVSIVEDGTVMYLSGGALGAIPAGKRWVGVDLSQAAGKLGIDLSSLTSGQTDPRTSLAQLREAGNVVEIGPAKVGGVEMTRYSVLIDLEKGLDRLDGAQRAAMEQILARLQATGGRFVPADAYIDSDGYVRRLKLALPNYLGSGTSFAFTLDVDGFGDPVDIVVPPAAEVADLTGLITSRLGS